MITRPVRRRFLQTRVLQGTSHGRWWRLLCHRFRTCSPQGFRALRVPMGHSGMSPRGRRARQGQHHIPPCRVSGDAHKGLQQYILTARPATRAPVAIRSHRMSWGLRQGDQQGNTRPMGLRLNGNRTVRAHRQKAPRAHALPVAARARSIGLHEVTCWCERPQCIRGFSCRWQAKPTDDNTPCPKPLPTQCGIRSA